MSKLENLYWGRNGAHFQLSPSSVKWCEMLKLEEKESPDSKLSDFEWFGEVFKIIMFNTFSWFYQIFLISELNARPILM